MIRLVQAQHRRLGRWANVQPANSCCLVEVRIAWLSQYCTRCGLSAIDRRKRLTEDQLTSLP